MSDIILTYKHYFKEQISRFLLKKGYSENNIYHLIKNNNVLINNKVVRDKNEYIPFKKSLIKVILNKEESDLPVCDKKIDIVYEDDYFLIVNKPFNLDIEPSKNNYEDNLATRVNNYFFNHGIESKIHLVNRLDKLTSGLVIVAKNRYIHNLFVKTKIKKEYLAEVEGYCKKKGTIKIKIKKEDNSMKRCVCDDGKLCISKYKTLSHHNNVSLVKVLLVTGRTHQIRVSFAHINHPLTNDPLYNTNAKSNNMKLIACSLKFIHPITKKKINVSL